MPAKPVPGRCEVVQIEIRKHHPFEHVPSAGVTAPDTASALFKSGWFFCHHSFVKQRGRGLSPARALEDQEEHALDYGKRKCISRYTVKPKIAF